MNRPLRGPLDAAELADAAVSAALVMSLLTMGRLLAAGTFFQVLATVVMTVLAARRRTRAVTAATVAAMALAVLLGGVGPVTQAFVSGLLGWAAGVAIARRYGLVRHLALALGVCWPIVSALTVGLLAVFGDLRELSLDNGRNQWLGLAEVLESAGLSGATEPGTRFVDWSIDHWWLMVPALQAAITIVYAMIVRRLGRAVLRRVDTALGEPWHIQPQGDVAPEPLPLTLSSPTVQHPGVDALQLARLDQTIGTGELVALVGGNGIGKTSLIEAVAGLTASTGVSGPGAPGLGRPGGTALIGQRPETQVVGLRVIDDVRWGLPLDEVSQAHASDALAAVGLDHLALHPTSQLSGGELQRLAVAAALARKPALLLSDESTAMLDPTGRAAIIDQLTAAAASGTTVIHSTHLDDEFPAFERAIELGPIERPTIADWNSAPTMVGAPALSTKALGYEHDAGSPWANRVFTGIDFAVGPGELALVIGSNGSGKTTFARLLAGLSLPTEGSVLLGDEPLVGPTPRIAIAFQHPRLQLLRSTVFREVASFAATRDATVVQDALRLLGFDPAVIGPQRIDRLSGGQQRRVLLAGMVARNCKVAILDEPLAGLDEDGRRRLRTVVDQLLAARTAVVLVSHDPAWAIGRADVTLDLDAVRQQVGAR